MSDDGVSKRALQLLLGQKNQDGAVLLPQPAVPILGPGSCRLSAHRGWARLLLDRRCLVSTSNTPRGYPKRSNYRSEHDEETAHGSYMNPESGFRAGPGDSYDTA